jgi:hypothetical protein
MKIQKRLMTAFVILFLLAALGISPAAALPTCADLGTNPAYGLAGNPQISGLMAVLLPAGVEPPPFPGFPATPYSCYCMVEFTVSTKSGPSAGYLPGQSQQIKIRVGLPPNSVDMMNPSAAGAVPWNGKNCDLGGGGYAGAVGSVTSSTNLGYVGTSTDTGHTGGSGSFALNPDGTLNWGLIEDFARDGIRQQYLWGVQLAKTYYGMEPTRKYWVGCSTGGRQGLYQAQNFPGAYDGILSGAPAINWDRFIPAELWPQIVMKEKVGQAIEACKLATVNNAALAACDGLDGLVDGVLDDPRRCDFDPQVLQNASCTSTDCNCLTAAEVEAVQKIWDGPRGTHGKFLWYGLEPTTLLSGPPFGGLAGPNPFPIAVDHFRYWIEQNPAFDWHTLDYASFEQDFRESQQLFNGVIGTDNPNLSRFRDSGGKILIWHGWTDSLIFPQGTTNYYERVLDRMGGSKHVERFARLFMAPGVDHCGGGAGPNVFDMFGPLVAWVEQGIPPDQIIATKYINDNPELGVQRTRPLCPYPLVARYTGTGNIDNAENFTCVKTIPALVRIEPATLKLGSKGTFTAFITLPERYDVRPWEIREVVCEGASAVKGAFVKVGHEYAHKHGRECDHKHGDTYKAKFNKQDLVNITPGEVPFTVTVILEHRGHHEHHDDYEHQIAFEGSDTVKVK